MTLSLLVRRRVRGQWRYNNTSAYIVARVAASVKQEGLNEYRVNGTECGANAADPAAAAAAAAGQVAATGRAPELSLAEKTMEVGRPYCLPTPKSIKREWQSTP